jgi:hypothetical protein
MSEVPATVSELKHQSAWNLVTEISQSSWKSISSYIKTTYLIINTDKILSFLFKISTFIYENLEFGGLQIFQILEALCGGSCCTPMGAAPVGYTCSVVKDLGVWEGGWWCWAFTWLSRIFQWEGSLLGKCVIFWMRLLSTMRKIGGGGVWIVRSCFPFNPYIGMLLGLLLWLYMTAQDAGVSKYLAGSGTVKIDCFF